MLIFLSLFFITAAFSQNLTGLKKRVAVMNFNDRSGYGHNIGSGLADMLVTRLVKSGKFLVVERKELDKILQEQGLGQSGLVTPQSAAKVGKLLGVELMVTGSVSEFGRKNKSVGGGIGRLAFGGRVSKKEARAVVDLRLVNTSTGEIIMAEKAEGKASSTSLSGIQFKDIDFGNPTTWDQTILGKAARKAVDKSVDYITKAMKKIPWEGKIIKVNADNTVYMKPGSAGGVQTGMEFAVFSQGEALIDPDTGLSLGSEESKIGVIKVIQDVAGGKACKAIIVSGSGFATGNPVRVK